MKLNHLPKIGQPWHIPPNTLLLKAIEVEKRSLLEKLLCFFGLKQPVFSVTYKFEVHPKSQTEVLKDGTDPSTA